MVGRLSPEPVPYRREAELATVRWAAPPPLQFLHLHILTPPAYEPFFHVNMGKLSAWTKLGQAMMIIMLDSHSRQPGDSESSSGRHSPTPPGIPKHQKTIRFYKHLSLFPGPRFEFQPQA